MGPPDGELYFVNVKSINGGRIKQRLEFQDMSLGGAKLRVPMGLNLQLFVVGAILEGELQCQDHSIDFKGKIRSINKKNLGIQFMDLGAEGKNMIWNELMSWYRQRKNKYVA
jgi:hypothetical protein